MKTKYFVLVVMMAVVALCAMFAGAAINWDSGLQIKIDNVDASTAYIGEAATGAATSAPVWRICKKTKAGNVTSIQFCNGNGYKDYIWDNRAAYTYK